MTDNSSSKSLYDSFEVWLKKFEKSPEGGRALKALEALYVGKPADLQARLKEEVLLVCHQSWLFSCAGDENSQKRDLLRDITNKDDEFLIHIRQLIREIAFFYNIHDVLMNEGWREFEPTDSDAPNQHDWPIKVDDLLAHLRIYAIGIERLKTGEESYSARNECWIYGNMRFPERIDGENQHKKSEPSTCLMFQLAVFFRLWTLEKDKQHLFDEKLNLNIPENGIKMPSKGKQHNDIIAAFVKATFSNDHVNIEIMDIDKQIDKRTLVAAIPASFSKRPDNKVFTLTGMYFPPEEEEKYFEKYAYFKENYMNLRSGEKYYNHKKEALHRKKKHVGNDKDSKSYTKELVASRLEKIDKDMLLVPWNKDAFWVLVTPSDQINYQNIA